MTAGDPVLASACRRGTDDLGILQVDDPLLGGHRFVAAGAPWYMTLFGRDSLLAAWMALPLDVELAMGTLHVPYRRVTVRPRLPDRWNPLELGNLRLGPAIMRMTINSGRVTMSGLPTGWELDPPGQV